MKATESAVPQSDADGEAAARYVPLLGLSWLHFLNDGSANFLPGVLPAVLASFGYSPALAGTLMFVLLVGQALQPVTGLLGRRFGGRKLMWFGVIGAAVFSGLAGFAPNLGWLVLALVLIGIANACFHPQALAAARRFAGRRGNFGVAIMMIGGEIGRGVWPLVASAAVVLGSLASLWVPALIALVTLPFVKHLLPPPRTRTGEWRIRLRGRGRATTLLLAYVALRGVVVIGASTYLPILWVVRGGGLIGGAALVTVMLVAGIAGTLYGAHLADRLGRRPVLIGAGVVLILAAALLACGAATSLDAALWTGAALLGVGGFGTFPVSTVIGQDLYPENRSFGSGLALGLGNAVGAGLVAALGLSLNSISLALLFWILAAIALLALPLAAILHAGGHDEARV